MNCPAASCGKKQGQRRHKQSKAKALPYVRYRHIFEFKIQNYITPLYHPPSIWMAAPVM